MDKTLKKFIKKLKKEFNINKIILFGSRARKDYLNSSDYDLIIVSNDFKKIDFVDRSAKIITSCNAFFPADFLCYTEKEFEKKSSQIGLVSTAIKEGKIIA